MNDYRFALMMGVDIPISELSLVAHAPTLKEIAYMGESQFFQAMQYLCLNKDQLIQDKSISSTLTNFQVLMKVLDQTTDKEKKKSVVFLLRILFPNYTVQLMPKSIIFSPPDLEVQPIMIDQNNFDTFQEAVKQILCASSVFQGSNIVYNPGNAKAQAIVDKIMEGRRRVAAQKQNSTESVLTRYVSILLVGLHLSIEQCGNMNIFQLFDQMERFTAQIEWDTDLRVRLAGGKPDKPVESWMRDIHPKN